MHRRAFLAGSAATVVATGIAGCSSIGGDGGGDGGNSSDAAGTDEPGDPKAVIQAYGDAGANGDTEEMRSYVHPEGPLESSSVSARENESATIDSIETTTQDEERAIVVAEGSVTRNGETQTFRIEYELRVHEGDWLIYTFSFLE